MYFLGELEGLDVFGVGEESLEVCLFIEVEIFWDEIVFIFLIFSL